MVVLVYEQGPYEGPEPKQLGSPFNCVVQPGLHFGAEDEGWAAELVKRVPQIRVVSGAPYPGWPRERINPDDLAQLQPPLGGDHLPEVNLADAKPEPLLPEPTAQQPVSPAPNPAPVPAPVPVAEAEPTRPKEQKPPKEPKEPKSPRGPKGTEVDAK